MTKARKEIGLTRVDLKFYKDKLLCFAPGSVYWMTSHFHLVKAALQVIHVSDG